MKIKRIAAALLTVIFLLGLAACGRRARRGTVSWLNADPAKNAAALALADRYERESGVTVRVYTPAASDYTTKLAESLRRRDPYTLFAVASEQELPDWQPSCLDLRGTKLAAALHADAPLLLGENDTVYGVGYGTACFGLIVNTALLARAGYEPSDIACFDDLRRVAEDIQARSDALGFTAFTSSGLARGSSWRFTRQLFSLPVSLEYRDNPALVGESVRGTYMKNYRAILNLYFDNCAGPASAFADAAVEDARREFLARSAVFYQNSSSEYDALIAGGLSDEELTMIPLYIGARGEESQGLCTDTEGYWCVNQNADAENVEATLEFLCWCASDPEAARVLGLERAFFDPAASENVFLRADYALTSAGKEPVPWSLDALPDDTWEKAAAAALSFYAAERTDEDWEDVRAALVDGWQERTERLNRE